MWYLTWERLGVGFGIERLKETREGLQAELTVESVVPSATGRLAGPVHLSLLSARSQTETANKIEKRVNGAIGKVDWESLVADACAIVAQQFREPTPLVDLSEIEAVTEVEYLVPGLIPLDETTVVYGDGESAKSLLVLRIAFSVISGHPLPWGDCSTRQCPVMYLDWETNPRTVAGRLRRITLGEMQPVPSFIYRQCFRSLQDDLPNIREEISRRGVGLVVVDSIGFAAHGALVEDETARSAMNALRQLSPATRLVVAHVSAETARDQTRAARPFGSAFFWNAMRSGLELRRAEDSPDPDVADLGLYHRKANDGEHHKPIALRVSFEGRRGPIAFDHVNIGDTPDLVARTSISSRLREILRRGAKTSAELAQLLDDPNVSPETVGRTLRRMPDAQRQSTGFGRGQEVEWGLLEQEAF